MDKQDKSATLHSPTLADEARMRGVSRRTLCYGNVVKRHGSDMLYTAVMMGEIAIHRAARIAKTVPKEKQLEAVFEEQDRRKQRRDHPHLEKMFELWPKLSRAEQIVFIDFVHRGGKTGFDDDDEDEGDS